jgi:N-acetylglutamate synthase-like GNAT family acetyltransferase
MHGEIQIVDYTPAYAKAFYDLNLDWISAAFKVEDDDYAVLSDPQKYLIEPGGAILVALSNGEPVGTCALKRINEDLVEMCKMTVARNMRGKHIGWMLGEAIIEKANQIGASTIELYSNRNGSALAIEMYKKLGFIEIPLSSKAYERADIKMQMML